MVSKKVKIINPTGLHLSPAGIFCQTAVGFSCKVHFRYDGDSIANAKSVLSVLGACIKTGDEIILECDGPDEEEALRAMVQAVESGLGE